MIYLFSLTFECVCLLGMMIWMVVFSMVFYLMFYVIFLFDMHSTLVYLVVLLKVLYEV